MATTHDTLADLALARGTLDRAGLERRDPDVLTRLLADANTRVAEVRDGRLLVGDDAGHPHLVLREPRNSDADRLAVHLGRDEAGIAYVAVISPDPPAGDGAASLDASGWLTLRQSGPGLSDRDAGIFTAALALANWHDSHSRCSRCGGLTEPVQAGWVRLCEVDGSEHYPRTDPAVIMSVLDPDERLLLGRSPAWPERRFSVLAGFVEPGESFAHAVEREVLEEVGLVIDETRYLGNQPWPFPSSVMIGYEARTRQTELALDHVELAEARWFSRSEYRQLLRNNAIRVPTGISIAKRIIEYWLGETVEAATARGDFEGGDPDRRRRPS
ncbi:MAG: NAD(+) diphosphatase [Micrococcales bacterium]|nr:NAD(+) diphosphatase [Micrococcales bacterium]